MFLEFKHNIDIYKIFSKIIFYQWVIFKAFYQWDFPL